MHQAGGELPEDWKNFLTIEGHHFYGAHIYLDVERLEMGCGVTPSNTHDLQMIVPTVREQYMCLFQGGRLRSSLNKVLHLAMKKTEFDYMKWAEMDLTTNQVEYATIDAYLSHVIAHRIMIEDGYNFR